MIHLFMAATVLCGGATVERWSPAAWGVPGAASGVWRLVVEGLLVYAPLVYHATYGLLVTFRRPTLKASADPEPADFWLRFTGLGVLVFVGFHLYQFPLQLSMGSLRQAELHSELRATLSSTSELGIPVAAIAYLLGLGATSAHFSLGLGSYLRGLANYESSRWLQLVEARVMWFGAVLFLLGALTVVQLATGDWIPRL